MLFKEALSFLTIFVGCLVHELWIGHELAPILLRTFGLTIAFLGVVYWVKLHTE